MNKTLLALAVVAVLLVGGFMLMKKSQPVMQPAPDVVNEEAPGVGSGTGSDAVDAGTSPAGEVMKPESAAKEFTLDSFEFGFDQKTITVNKGDTVKLTLTNSGKMMHDWVVDEFNAKTKRIANGQEDTISFVADKAGTFEFYCSVGNHRAQGMVGKLVVE